MVINSLENSRTNLDMGSSKVGTRPFLAMSTLSLAILSGGTVYSVYSAESSSFQQIFSSRFVAST